MDFCKTKLIRLLVASIFQSNWSPKQVFREAKCFQGRGGHATSGGAYNCRKKGFRAILPPPPKNPAYSPACHSNAENLLQTGHLLIGSNIEDRESLRCPYCWVDVKATLRNVKYFDRKTHEMCANC